ncbi:MAG: UDP-2,3-diacylglucosamine diphosphatase [Thiotrichaceae bacterium]|nr:UDP-2,3-diacylglucosamine diphosphatase [Thiotrichaceae bacterium]
MSETLFIADLHLTPRKDIIPRHFLTFLATRARKIDALYILGDLFDVWLGDDDKEPIYQEIKVALHNLTSSGVPIFFMHGNRDFLLGTRFAKLTACQLIDDPHLINLYGTPNLLMHGDTLCTQDIGYLAFRQRVRKPLWQKLFLAQPLLLRRYIAKKIRTNSQAKTQTTTREIMDVTSEAVISALETKGVYNLIHGHTHRPARHQFKLNERIAHRFVLGDWHEDKAIILSCTPDGCKLIDLLAR